MKQPLLFDGPNGLFERPLPLLLQDLANGLAAHTTTLNAATCVRQNNYVIVLRQDGKKFQARLPEVYSSLAQKTSRRERSAISS